MSKTSKASRASLSIRSAPIAVRSILRSVHGILHRTTLKKYPSNSIFKNPKSEHLSGHTRVYQYTGTTFSCFRNPTAVVTGWGLDFRRISRVGSRLSTNQIMGFVSITANHNPKIQDTSDRERLVSTREAAEFGEILKAVVSMLEIERTIDRTQGIVYEPMEDLLSHLNAEELLVTLNELVENKASAKDVVTPVREHDHRLKSTRKSIEKRFFYYSRLATVGTISQMLIHEIRNRTSIIGNFLVSVAKIPSLFNDEKFSTIYNRTGRALVGLDKLAKTFAPLANVRFSKQKRKSVLEDQIDDCLDLQERALVSKGIKCSKPNTRTGVAVDPGELDTILMNLILNSVYWLNEVPLEKRELNFTVENSTVPGRVTVVVEDTGPGISEVESRMIFNPGVTRKPNGIGMGLTVAAELVHSYGGKWVSSITATRGHVSFSICHLTIKYRRQRWIDLEC